MIFWVAITQETQLSGQQETDDGDDDGDDDDDDCDYDDDDDDHNFIIINTFLIVEMFLYMLASQHAILLNV